MASGRGHEGRQGQGRSQAVDETLRRLLAGCNLAAGGRRGMNYFVKVAAGIKMAFASPS